MRRPKFKVTCNKEKVMKYLLAVDLEGAHGVVGEAYKGLIPGMKEYDKAVENVTKEVNAATEALYDYGAAKVFVWDNHGNLDNLDFKKVDPRAEKIKPQSNSVGRLDFLSELSIDAMLFIGYHSREGSLNGVLAHTYSSQSIQYYKIDGKQVGEFDIDGIIAESFGVPSVFLSSDDVCVNQFLENRPYASVAVTKIGKGRNEAEFLPEKAVLDEIKKKVGEAVRKAKPTIKNHFPCAVEIRYTRTEAAADAYKKLNAEGIRVVYGEDAHVLFGVARSKDELRKYL